MASLFTISKTLLMTLHFSPAVFPPLLLITMGEGEKGIREAIGIRRFHMPLEQEGRDGSPTITFCCATNKDDNNF